ncbi:MAG TPA: hypothetical protein VGF40_00270 [Thermoanaerobaculia bacterium]
MDRRELLAVLLAIPWAPVVACSRGSWLAREMVCAHVFRPRVYLPPPLLEPLERERVRRRAGRPLTVGLPELLLCAIPRDPVERFPFMWPLTEEEVRAFASAMRILWSAERLESRAGAAQLLDALRRAPAGERTAVLFTMNRDTAPGAPAVAAAARDGDAGHLVVFKDPSIPPYFCDYPALQKRFKHPPP